MELTVSKTINKGEQKKESILVDIHDGKIRVKSDFIAVQAESVNQEKNTKAWEHLSDINTIVQPMNTVVEKIISGVPDYNWLRGCSPTAAANIMAYWQAHGYSRLPVGTTLINQLADAMGTAADGSTPWANIPTGIHYVALRYAYNTWVEWNESITGGRVSSTYDKFKNEINGRPLMASFTNSSTYGCHSTTGVGYRYDDYQDWIIVHDTWNTTPTNVYLDYNSTEVRNPVWTYVHPGQ